MNPTEEVNPRDPSLDPGQTPTSTPPQTATPSRTDPDEPPEAMEFEEKPEDMDQSESVQDEMDAMMDQYLDRMTTTQSPGQMLRVAILAIQDDAVLVDIGDKSEGVVDPAELMDYKGKMRFSTGDVIDVIIKGTDRESGLTHLSYSEAQLRVAYKTLEEALKAQTPVTGEVVRAVKGGLIVNVGTTAFLPASQIDLRRVEDMESWIGKSIECLVLEFDPAQRRAVVSRRKLLERERIEKRREILRDIEPGKVIHVRVKRLTDFGAFVDLGGIDGLIPRSEISWHRSARPEDYLAEGEELDVKVIEINRDDQKITLSRRQARENPWDKASELFSKGRAVEGKVVSITSYGAFVRLSEGLDGMIHISDMAWDSMGKRPSDYLAAGQQIQAVVLNLDVKNKRISLGLKQLSEDPWDEISQRYPPMTRIKGKVTGLTQYGAFVELEPGIEGMIHISDLSWDKQLTQPRDVVKKGEEIEACVLSVDRERRRISLSVKQLTENPITLYGALHKAGEIVESKVIRISDIGVVLQLAEGIEGFIHVSQLDSERVEKPLDICKIGDMIEAEITKIDEDSGKVSMSRRQMLKKEQRRILKSFTSSKTSGGGHSMSELLADIKLEDDLPNE